jgi:NAD+ kinase
LKNQADKIKRIGVIGNSGKASAGAAVAKAARLIRATGRSVCTDAATAALARLNAEVFSDAAAVARQSDLILVFGGDGTMLRIAREIAGSRTPMLGINIGGLGFLTAVPSAELAPALKRVWKGDFTYETRVLLEATARSNGQLIQQTALNDVVISRGIASRLIELEVRVDGEPLTNYRCDGLIISSPTGSTAYSLAAGGAVVFPTAEVLALTPICPHTLSNRSLILPINAVIEVKIVNPKPSTVFSVDGQMVSELAEGDVITVKRSRKAARLMHLAGTTFCETLRRKLHWRGASL